MLVIVEGLGGERLIMAPRDERVSIDVAEAMPCAVCEQTGDALLNLAVVLAGAIASTKVVDVVREVFTEGFARGERLGFRSEYAAAEAFLTGHTLLEGLTGDSLIGGFEGEAGVVGVSGQAVLPRPIPRFDGVAGAFVSAFGLEEGVCDQRAPCCF